MTSCGTEISDLVYWPQGRLEYWDENEISQVSEGAQSHMRTSDWIDWRSSPE